MPSPAEVARRHYAGRRRLISAVAGEARRLWRQVDPDRIGESWLSQLGRLLLVLTGAQQAAAGQSDAYLNAVLAAQGFGASAVGRVSITSLSGVASDGRDLATLLYQPAATTLTAIGRGATVDRALAGGYAHLDMIARTQVADAGRVADAVAMTARPEVSGYRRMLVGASCSRCVILAGRWYAYNAGFDRHPRCRPGVTASTFRPARTPPTTPTPTHASTSTASAAKSRTEPSPRRARRRSGSAPTRPRSSTPAAALLDSARQGPGSLDRRPGFCAAAGPGAGSKPKTSTAASCGLPPRA